MQGMVSFFLLHDSTDTDTDEDVDVEQDDTGLVPQVSAASRWKGAIGLMLASSFDALFAVLDFMIPVDAN